MNGKMKDCFGGHALMHSLIGLGLGILLVSLIPSLDQAWLGLVLIILGIILDYTRKGK